MQSAAGRTCLLRKQVTAVLAFEGVTVTQEASCVYGLESLRRYGSVTTDSSDFCVGFDSLLHVTKRLT